MAFVFMIGCTVAANLLMKTGASVHETGSDFISRITSWPVLLGMAFFAAAAVMYVLILSWLPLNVAQSFAAAQFVAVIIAARLFLGEPINGPQWAGVVLISLGILVVGSSQ